MLDVQIFDQLVSFRKDVSAFISAFFLRLVENISTRKNNGIVVQLDSASQESELQGSLFESR